MINNNIAELIIAIGLVNILLVLITAISLNLKDMIKYFQTKVDLRKERLKQLKELKN